MPRFNIAEILRETELGEQTLHFANESGNKIHSYEVFNYFSFIIQLIELQCEHGFSLHNQTSLLRSNANGNLNLYRLTFKTKI